MTDDRRQRIEQIYLDALDIPAVDRPGFLDRACAGDQALRTEVEALLALQSGAEAFLEQPAIESAARALADILPALRPPEIPGYKIIRHLGEGGMGLVYLAEQQAPLRRLVALKVIRPGMDSLQVVARFNAERQALAQMDHPNIAAVHDAGATSDGRPFFVMEFVDGLPISEYCDRKALPTVARLELFTQVCAGVQHAHQKGVIHRDLKPSNVLVAEHDGRPVPKVIDFGTAKAIDRSAGDAVTLTAHGMVLGTIEYMSPEQAAFSRDIDTTTDVYSLGVMLYELLVGVLPFERPRPGPEGYDELRRLIRESDPERPSARLSTIAESRAGIASARQTDPDRLRRALQGDLDWITLKALEKDRTRRYPTVAAFASDIRRFLSDQTVDARPPSAAYRIRKFTRRHRGAVAAAVSLVVVLVAGLVASRWQYLRAESARAAAEGAIAEANILRLDAEQLRRLIATLEAEQQRRLTGSGKPTTARLQLEQFPLDTRVHLDGQALGTVGADGKFTIDVPPRASGTLIFQRPGYEPSAPHVRAFAAGTTVVMSGTEVPMTRLPVMVQFVTVPGTIVTIHQSGKQVRQFTNTNKVPLQEGSYELTSQGPAGLEMTDPFTVTATSGDRTVTVRVISGIERFEGWNLVSGWYYRRAATDLVVPYQNTVSDGRFTFTVRRENRRGNQFSTADRLRWAVGYVDAQNCIVYELDWDTLYRSEWRQGATVKSSEIRIPHQIPVGGTPVHFTVQAQGGTLKISYSVEANVTTWLPIDTWNLGTPDTKIAADLLPKGRFAFLLKAGEELWIQNFRYYPAPARGGTDAPAPASPLPGGVPDSLPAVSALPAGRTRSGRGRESSLVQSPP